MHKKLKLLIFACFILCLTTISFAAAPAMVYFVDKSNNTLNVCNVQSNANLSNCRGLYTISGINAVAVSPNGHNVFFSTKSNEVYGCIREDDGTLSYCKSGPTKFYNPQSMSFDYTHYIYITNQGDNSVTVCAFDFYGQLYDCDTAVKFQAPPVSIAISFDDRYAYVALPEVQKIAICPINPDLTFGLCNFVMNSAFQQPISVSADPMQTYIYILDGASLYSGVSCLLTNFGYAIGYCSSYTIDPLIPGMPSGRIGSAMDIIPLYFQKKDFRGSYIAATTGINFCGIVNYEYSCAQTVAQGYGLIDSVAYAYGTWPH